MGNQAGNQARMLLTQISWVFNLVLNWVLLLQISLVSMLWVKQLMLKIQISLVRVLVMDN
jgi:hypothetical protein